MNPLSPRRSDGIVCHFLIEATTSILILQIVFLEHLYSSLAFTIEFNGFRTHGLCTNSEREVRFPEKSFQHCHLCSCQLNFGAMDLLTTRLLEAPDRTICLRSSLVCWAVSQRRIVPREMQLRSILADQRGRDSLISAGLEVIKHYRSDGNVACSHCSRPHLAHGSTRMGGGGQQRGCGEKR